MFENNTIIYKFVQDLQLFVTGGDDENELALLRGFFDAVAQLLRNNVDKREALENLDLILLCLDEIVDGGMILETDANSVVAKVQAHSVDSGAPLAEQVMKPPLDPSVVVKWAVLEGESVRPGVFSLVNNRAWEIPTLNPFSSAWSCIETGSLEL